MPSSAPQIPAAAKEALAVELACETGAASIVDGAGTYDKAKLDRADRLLQAAYPHLLAAFKERLEQFIESHELNGSDLGWAVPTTSIEAFLELLEDGDALPDTTKEGIPDV